MLATLAGAGDRRAVRASRSRCCCCVLPPNAYEDAFAADCAGSTSAALGARLPRCACAQAELPTAGRRRASTRSASSTGSCTRTTTTCVNVGGWERAADHGHRCRGGGARSSRAISGRCCIGDADYRAFKAQHAAALQPCRRCRCARSLLLMPGPTPSARRAPRPARRPLTDGSDARQPVGRRSRRSTRRRVSARRSPSSAAILSARPWDWEVRVVDDGSADGPARSSSEAAARSRASSLQREPHRGKGGAVKAGLLRRAATYRFICDADLSMPVAELPRFLPPTLTDFDVAIGSREGHGARRIGEPLVRHLAGRASTTRVQQLMVRASTTRSAGSRCSRRRGRGDLSARDGRRLGVRHRGAATSPVRAGCGSWRCRSSGTTGGSRSSACSATARHVWRAAEHQGEGAEGRVRSADAQSAVRGARSAMSDSALRIAGW